MHPAKSPKKPRFCQVAGCGCSLEDAGRYCQKRRICRGCSQASAVQQEDGRLLRFCQQHGRLEPLASFSGVKRSCRSALEQRRISAAGAAAAPASTQSSNSSDSNTSCAQQPIQVGLGLSSNSPCSSLVGSDHLQLLSGEAPAVLPAQHDGTQAAERPTDNAANWASVMMADPAATQTCGAACNLGAGGIHSAAAPAAAAEDAELEQLIEQALLEAAAGASSSGCPMIGGSMASDFAFLPSVPTAAPAAPRLGLPTAVAPPGQLSHQAKQRLLHLQQQYLQLQGALDDVRHLLLQIDPPRPSAAASGPSPAALMSWSLAASQASEWHGFGGAMFR